MEINATMTFSVFDHLLINVDGGLHTALLVITVMLPSSPPRKILAARTLCLVPLFVSSFAAKR